MWVDADYFTPYDSKKCVTGEFWPVESTPLNFKQPHAIGEHINDDYGQLHVVNGYDHAWALNLREMILARQHGYMMKKVDVKWKFILPNQQSTYIQETD